MAGTRKTMLLLVAVLVAFVVCTFPSKIRWLVESFVPDPVGKNDVGLPIYAFAELMYPFHLAINPLIYAVGDVKFRKELGLKGFGRCRMCCCRHGTKRSDDGGMNGFYDVKYVVPLPYYPV